MAGCYRTVRSHSPAAAAVEVVVVVVTGAACNCAAGILVGMAVLAVADYNYLAQYSRSLDMLHSSWMAVSATAK